MAPTMPSPHRTLKRQLQQARELPQVTGTPCRQTARVCEFCLHSHCVETEASASFGCTSSLHRRAEQCYPVGPVESLLQIWLCSSTTLLRMPASTTSQPAHLLWKGSGYHRLTPSRL